MPEAGRPADLVLGYIDRVVNRRDISAVDELVSPQYIGSGHGWPADVTALRAFYLGQYGSRPDWRIDVQDVVELGSTVVVRAHAGGFDTAARHQRSLEWLTRYRVDAGRIVEVAVLEVVEHPAR